LTFLEYWAQLMQ
nr:Chain C, PEPTIDE INHIBITOR M3 [synthetic construct]5UML_D Chain D, PEPTIDE INHIBITOR M3 [synthetic construct]5UML_F Chain F, PEPTIDE INHIBITOR M3 [synthetic construct]5UML_H Chain H, PEPTIDE INHIBITOR M3 [synthetic construct]5UMM_B Chain B, PEPTIDE INHIBITOR M3 [synthetic construct]5UMM_D Chain D, PEPTIDE INHIBITOR M3 [synthetic construct]